MELFSAIPCPALLTTQNGLIVQINEALEKLLHTSSDVLIQNNIYNFIDHVKSDITQTADYPLMLEVGEVSEIRLQVKSRNNEVILITAHCKSIINEGQKLYFWVFSQSPSNDRAEKKMDPLNSSINSSGTDVINKAEAVNLSHTELEKFIRTVSHDLRSPLITIEHFSKILRKELGPQLNDKQRHRFERISFNINNMGAMLDDLRLLSQVMTAEVIKTHIDVQKIFLKTWGSLEHQRISPGAELQFQGNLFPVYANLHLLSICVSHILSNALRYCDGGRNLIIRVNTTQTKNFIDLSVSDNGIGIAAENHERIFGVFEQVSSGKGTGIGLSVVQAVMKKHHGEVILKSATGKGSSFILRFPQEQD